MKKYDVIYESIMAEGKENDEAAKIKQAKAGENLDVLMDDESPKVRVEVAKQGFGLSILIDDEDESVRKAVKDTGYTIESED